MSNIILDIKIMSHQKKILVLVYVLIIFLNCTGQEKKVPVEKQKVGGYCEGCSAIFEYGNKKLSSSDTLPGFLENNPKLKITGTVFKKDGKTPAENIVLYIYYTNRNGIYETKGDEIGWAKKHGFIRGWIKTGKEGEYTFYTFLPGAYPNRKEPKHIHITIKEPDKNEYFIDGYVFDNDPLLTRTERNKLDNRGGSGIIKPKIEEGLLTAKRNIILGKNIPHYE
ncbi:MAG: intradiol ring-cleavage dioxygenase [Bacteroidota bacterium]